MAFLQRIWHDFVRVGHAKRGATRDRARHRVLVTSQCDDVQPLPTVVHSWVQKGVRMIQGASQQLEPTRVVGDPQELSVSPSFGVGFAALKLKFSNSNCRAQAPGLGLSNSSSQTRALKHGLSGSGAKAQVLKLKFSNSMVPGVTPIAPGGWPPEGRIISTP
jgi:hypothetical protein